MAVNRNREQLRLFLEQNAKNPARVSEATEILEPLFRNNDQGAYPLARAEELDPAEVAQVIATATGRTVKRVVFVSREHPFPKPEWMSEKVYEAFYAHSFDGSLRDNSWDILRDIFRDIGGSLWDSLWNSLGNNLWDNLRYILGGSLWDSLGDRLWGSFRSSIGRSVGGSVFYYLGFSLLNDAVHIEQLAPFVRLLPRAIPLGEKADEPGIWIVLVA